MYRGQDLPPFCGNSLSETHIQLGLIGKAVAPRGRWRKYKHQIVIEIVPTECYRTVVFVLIECYVSRYGCYFAMLRMYLQPS
jgi:hypothetical protein